MKYFWVLMLFVSLFSCQDVEKVERPNDLISQSKMVDVLTDLSLLNSAKNFNRRLLEETGLKPDVYLFEKHNIDSLQLSKSTEYYARNSSQLEQIYVKVQKNLEKMRTKLEIVRAEEERVKDSIKALEDPEDSLGLKPKILITNFDSITNYRSYKRDYRSYKRELPEEN
jgi:hypothetical protein